MPADNKDKAKKDVVAEKLRELVLSDNANDLDFQPHPAASSEVRLGLKSTERLDLEKQRLPTQMSGKELSDFVQDMANIRRMALERAASNRIEWEERHTRELAERKQKDREESIKLMMQHESPTQREKRLEGIKIRDEARQQEIKQLHNRMQRDIEETEIFFNIGQNKFNSKYGHHGAELNNIGTISKIISSRKFSNSEKYGGSRLAYKCAVCPFPETLALRTVLSHIHTSNGTLHKDRVLDLISSEYNQLEQQKRFEWKRLDNDPDYYTKTARDELETISKIKVRSPDNISGYKKINVRSADILGGHKFTKRDSDKLKVESGLMNEAEFLDKWGPGE